MKGVSLTPDIQSKGLDFHNELIREAKLKKKKRKEKAGNDKYMCGQKYYFLYSFSTLFIVSCTCVG